MILYIRKTSNFEQVENFLLNHPIRNTKQAGSFITSKSLETARESSDVQRKLAPGEAARPETTKS